MNKKNSRHLLFIVGLIIILVLVQAFREVGEVLSMDANELSALIWKAGYVKPEAVPFIDNIELYGDDKADITVEELYVTVLPTVDEDLSQSFAAVNAITTHDQAVPVFKAYVTASPDLIQMANNDDLLSSSVTQSSRSLEDLKANATITLRGQSSYLSREKSYKIQFEKNGETWHGFRTLSLNKHPFDHSRIRNKVCFDLFELIPDFSSLRTRWVHLFIQDLTAPNSARYQDCGLYEFIELTNEKYLKDRMLDENGIIFKAQFFEFYRYEDAIKPVNDPTFALDDFNYYLELKAGNAGVANKKLIRMLDDLNNENLDIDQVFDKYFNRDNYFTYLALHILLGNLDSEERNYYLYSPHDSLTWYFLPWDYDKSLSADIAYDIDGKKADLIGIAHYWGIILHNRMFQKPHNIDALNQKIEAIYRLIYPGMINRLIDKYLPVAQQYSLDDLLYYEDVTEEEFDAVISQMRQSIGDNRAEYYATLEQPMPVYLGDVEVTNDGYRFGWSESLDLQGDLISYNLQVSLDPAFKEIVFEKSRITTTEYYLNLDPGDYYWRVQIRDAKGNLQRAFDEYIGDDEHYFGLKAFTIA